jgi:hypothetical protein
MTFSSFFRTTAYLTEIWRLCHYGNKKCWHGTQFLYLDDYCTFINQRLTRIVHLVYSLSKSFSIAKINHLFNTPKSNKTFLDRRWHFPLFLELLHTWQKCCKRGSKKVLLLFGVIEQMVYFSNWKKCRVECTFFL